jgi:hypothetical protein
MTRLAPITTRRLNEFRRRRNTLLTARGLSAGLLVLMGMALLFVPVDAVWTLPDSTRYVFAAMIYIATAAVIFFLAIQPWLQGRSITWLASLLEKADPRLENRLLAAVELSDVGAPDKPVLDSAAFRESVQRDVAKILETVPIARALPWRLVGRWLLLSGALMVSVAILCSFQSLHLPTRLTRVLFPMANVGRVSQFLVSVTKPSPSSTTVPEDELIEIRANVRSSGFQKSPHSVFLEVRRETESSDAKAERIAMRIDSSVGANKTENNDENATDSEALKSNGETYQTNWNVGQGIRQYRVVADDSATGWYSIHGVARPTVESFEVEYRYPSYTLLEPEKHTTPNGNLEAIEGTTAKVFIRVNQPIASAYLRVAPKSRGVRITPNFSSNTAIPNDRLPIETTIDFQRTGGSEVLVAEVPIQENGTYRISLTATETGFTNSFAPNYSIRAIPDRAPKIAWQTPREPSISVTPESILALSIQTEDELPIARLVQQIREGTHEWEDQSDLASQLQEIKDSSIDDSGPASAIKSGASIRKLSFRQSLDNVFDLAMNRVKIGDTLQMRWVATDRKGQSTTSPILEMFVASASLDPSRRERMLDRLTVTRESEKVRAVVEKQIEALKSKQQAFESDRDNPERHREIASLVKDFVEESKQTINQLESTILETMPKLKDSVSAEEFDRLSQVVNKVRTEQIAELERLSSQDTKSQDPRKSTEKMVELLNKGNADLKLATRRAKEFTGHDVLSQIGHDLSTMLKYQQDLKGSVDSILPEQYRRKQAIIARQFKELADMTREHSPLLRDNAQRQASQWADWMDGQASSILAFTGSDDRPKVATDSETDRKKLADRIESELRDHQQPGSIDGGLHDENRKSRNELRDKASRPSKLIEKLADSIAKSSVAQNESKASVNNSNDPSDQLLQSALNQISHQRAIQQARNDSDSQWIADLGDAHRAAHAIVNQPDLDSVSPEMNAKANEETSNQSGMSAEEKVEKLKAVASSIKKLEAVHELQQAARTLDELQATERWKGLSAEARLEQPRQWDAMKQRLERSVTALREAGFPKEIVENIDKIKWNDVANRLDQKISPRRWSNEPWVNASEDLRSMQKSLREETKKIEQAAHESRMSLAGLAPTVSELARNASKSFEETIAPTETLAKSISEGTVPDRNARIDQVDDKIGQSKLPVQMLREALSDMASRQDLMKAEASRVARDADAASGIVQQAQQRIQDSIAASRDATEDRDAQDALEESAGVQRDAAEAMTMIAEHFDGLAQAKKSAALAGESDEGKLAGTLAEAVKQMPENNPLAPDDKKSLDMTYDEADKLRKLSSSNPERVLAQLEKELPRNSQMQQELSKIARNAIDDSMKTLDYSAKKEESLEVEIENSDEDYREQKESLQRAIQESAEMVSRLTETVLPRIRSTTERGQLPAISTDVDRMRKDLRSAADASKPSSSNQSMDTIKNSAKSLGRAIEQSKRELTQQTQKLEKGSSNSVAADESQLKSRRRESEDWQRNFRNQDINYTQQIENQSKQSLLRVEQKLKETRKSVEQRRKEANDAKRQAEQKPEDAARVARLEQKNQELQKAERIEAQVAEQVQEAEKRLDEAKSRREGQQSQQLDELAANNPHLQLGSKVAASAAEQAKNASEVLQQALAEASRVSKEQPSEPSPTSEALHGPKASRDKVTSAADQQEALVQGVAEASESIARAARHETRMQNAAIGDALMQQSKAISDLANGEMRQSQESLMQASQEEPTPATAAAQPYKPANVSTEATVQSMQSLLTAKDAIEKAAHDLQSTFGEQSATKKAPAASSGASPSSQANSGSTKPPPKSLLSPQEMARMLDELDQQLAKEKASQEKSAEQAAASGSAKGRSSSASESSGESMSDASERAATLAEATRRLAASMNQQRGESESAKKQSSLASAQASDSRAVSRPGDSSDAVVLGTEVKSDGDWGRLQEQSAEESAETVREGIAPVYRKQVEEYFKILSTKD